jgi:hypothetical protein
VNLGLRVFIRVVAWTVALGAVVVLFVGYDRLPAEIPVTRWTAAPKSLFIVLRVPLINLMPIGLVELVSPALHRATQFKRADTVVSVLLLTAAAKTGIETVGILLSTVSSSWTVVPLVAVLFVGLGSAAFFSREFLRPQRWRHLQLTRLEITGAVAVVAGIAALNLPIIFRDMR